MKRLFCFLLAGLFSSLLHADFDYRLQPRQVASDVYVLIGKTEDFSLENGGNIVNAGFIVAPGGVIVIDSGSSLRYGQQFRAAIARVTDRPVAMVINTHHHPDHFLGNQAFADVPVAALPEVREAILREGNAFAENLYRLSGDWMKGTEVFAPNRALSGDRLEVAGRQLRLIPLRGHTGADLALYDDASGVLFAGDLVFHDRAPTTPHADVTLWLQSLDRLSALVAAPGFKVLVPGHGEPVSHDGPIRQTRDWLRWLQAAMRDGARDGLDMVDMLKKPIPEPQRTIPLAGSEYRRSVTHLFPAAELEALEKSR